MPVDKSGVDNAKSIVSRGKDLIKGLSNLKDRMVKGKPSEKKAIPPKPYGPAFQRAKEADKTFRKSSPSKSGPSK